ncbi:MAG: Gfo/Idh/MocA family oxidoreductase, partial [Planctomycetes bacterium]|nr:Gfo/Idh/MocA family oxidoreductase [Planctomycetota bacterium]
MSKAQKLNRREFLGTALTATAAFTILPRHVLGSAGYVAPSDRITIGCVGVGAQGTRVMMDFLRQSDVQIVSVCDVNSDSSTYCEWGPNELRDKVRELIGNSRWGAGAQGCRAGREPAREIVEGYYARQKPSGKYTGCTTYRDYREMLEKERDIDAIIVCTPDHNHAIVSMTAMKLGKHVYCQKPFTHSIFEARELARVSRETKVATQVAVGNQASEATRLLAEWIGDGAIGAVGEV